MATERLLIKNFAGLKEIDIEIKKINILIGPQASGKSIVDASQIECIIVCTRCPLTSTDVQKYKVKLKKQYRAKLLIQSGKYIYKI